MQSESEREKEKEEILAEQLVSMGGCRKQRGWSR
jgi:hypothetical protein